MKPEGAFRIYGQVRGALSRRGLPGLTVQALDKDLCFDDRLGTAITDRDGGFEIRYGRSDFQDFFDNRPDIYLRVFAPSGDMLHTTERAVRYEAGDTEQFFIELPEKQVQIGSSEGLRRRIVSDPVLQRELAESVGELLAAKGLLDPSLIYTFVPVVVERPAANADLFPTGLGPQPEPPDSPTGGGIVRVNPQPEPPLPRLTDKSPTRAREKSVPPPRWWWIGLPAVELLKELERYRISNLTTAESPAPARDAEQLAHRIMVDKGLVTELATRIDAVLANHGVIPGGDKTYSFVPVVSPRPIFASEALGVRIAVPRIIDSAGQAAAAAWISPLDGIPPPELLQELAGLSRESVK